MSMSIVEAEVVTTAPPATGDVGMKMTVGDVNAFVAALDLVKLGVLGRSTLPILSHIRLDAAAGRVRLTATNLTYGVTVDVPATVEVEGTTTVPAKLFVDFVNTLSKDWPLSLEYSLRSKQVLVVSGRDKARIKVLGAEDFPVVHAMDDITGAIEMPASDVSKGVKRTLFAAGVDTSRPLLTYVRWRFLPDNKMDWGSADGFRLSLATFDLDHGLPATAAGDPWLVPAPALAVLGKMVKDAGSDEIVYARRVQPKMGRPHLLLRRGTSQLDVELGDGNFPAVEQVVPKSWTTRVTADRSLLRQAVARAGFLSRNDANAVKLVADSIEQTLTISGKSTEFGDSVARVAVVLDGEGSQIAFSASYLKPALEAIEGDVVIEFTQPTAPAAFRARGDETWVHVVMPMSLS